MEETGTAHAPWLIPAEIWEAAPKDAWWWMDAMPYDDGDDYDPLDYIDDDDE